MARSRCAWALLIALVLAASPARATRNDLNPFLVAGTAATGFSSGHPYLFGRAGVQIEERHFFIGLHLSTLLQAGFAADFLFYVIRGKRFALHIVDPGVGWNAFGHTLSVPDVDCEHCVKTINGTLGAMEGVEAVSTDLPSKTVQLRYDPDRVSLEAIEEALDDAGYTVAK